MLLLGLKIQASKKKAKNMLAGAIDIAIKDAELFGTSLVIKGKNGQVREVSPRQMKNLIARKS